MLTIKVANTNFTIDEDSYERIKTHNDNPTFHLNNWGNIVFWSKKLQRTVYLSRIVLGSLFKNGYEVDHIDRNKLNNIKSNLRWCTSSQNNCNRAKKKTASSKYKGVNYDKNTGRWKVGIAKHKKRIYGGLFENEIEAANKADDLILEHHGRFALTNFQLYGA